MSNTFLLHYIEVFAIKRGGKTQFNIEFTIPIVTNIKEENVFINENLHRFLRKVSHNTLPFLIRTAYCFSKHTPKHPLFMTIFKVEGSDPPLL